MKRAIYQVCLGKAKDSRLYKLCMDSVRDYCERHDIKHIVQTHPKLRITPDPFMSNRSKESWQKHGGFLPIYEKENAFDFLDDYDQLAIIDADIYIRPDAPNIFEDMECNCAFGAVCEREMPITEAYKAKITNYSMMQYKALHNPSIGIDFKPNNLGFEFFNMGMIVLNCQQFKPYLKGQTAEQFIKRAEFMDFVNGKGPWKWSTDQTMLNFFLRKYKPSVKHLDWKWNGLYTANNRIEECYFVHFFLKDLLPQQGENIEELMKLI